MGSIIAKAVARPLHSVLHNHSKNIWRYFMDFFCDFLFQLMKGFWLLSINLRFQVSPQKKILSKSNLEIAETMPCHQIHRLNGREMPLSQSREVLGFEKLLELRSFSFTSHPLHNYTHSLLSQNFLTDSPLHLTISTRDTFFHT